MRVSWGIGVSIVSRPYHLNNPWILMCYAPLMAKTIEKFRVDFIELQGSESIQDRGLIHLLWSLVNADLFYANFTNKTFQKKPHLSLNTYYKTESPSPTQFLVNTTFS